MSIVFIFLSVLLSLLSFTSIVVVECTQLHLDSPDPRSIYVMPNGLAEIALDCTSPTHRRTNGRLFRVNELIRCTIKTYDACGNLAGGAVNKTSWMAAQKWVPSVSRPTTTSHYHALDATLTSPITFEFQNSKQQDKYSDQRQRGVYRFHFVPTLVGAYAIALNLDSQTTKHLLRLPETVHIIVVDKLRKCVPVSGVAATRTVQQAFAYEHISQDHITITKQQKRNDLFDARPDSAQFFQEDSAAAAATNSRSPLLPQDDHLLALENDIETYSYDEDDHKLFDDVTEGQFYLQKEWEQGMPQPSHYQIGDDKYITAQSEPMFCELVDTYIF
eukprot:PhM_4_TR12889/c0_g1_i1/m.36486